MKYKRRHSRPRQAIAPRARCGATSQDSFGGFRVKSCSDLLWLSAAQLIMLCPPPETAWASAPWSFRLSDGDSSSLLAGISDNICQLAYGSMKLLLLFLAEHPASAAGLTCGAAEHKGSLWGAPCQIFACCGTAHAFLVARRWPPCPQHAPKLAQAQMTAGEPYAPHSDRSCYLRHR